MKVRDHLLNDSRLLRRAIIAHTQEIRVLNDGGRSIEAAQVAGKAVELIVEVLGEAVLSASSSAEVIAILKISTQFCAILLAYQEALGARAGSDSAEACFGSDRKLLAQFVAARARASDGGLSVATLDFVDLLSQLHKHLLSPVPAKVRSSQLALASHGT